jgi:Xaa-Pro aminopeptidase
MNRADVVAAIQRRMADEGLERIVAVHDGAHFIETPNPVMVLSGFKSLGAAAVVLERNGDMQLVVTPQGDAERAKEAYPGAQVVGAADVVEGLSSLLGRNKAGANATGIAGIPFAPWSMAQRLDAALPGTMPADAIVMDAARAKTADEIANAREATRIAEAGFERLLQLAKPGLSEDELASELRWHSKSLGAEDNFLMLCAGPHNRAVAPSCGRRLQHGDIILAEITPSYRGQLAQICRTAVLGPAPSVLKEKYALVVEAMHAGIRVARPGLPMAEVCRAINTVLEAQGYGEYCYPPHIRRRGHGLGFGSILPGDVALDNETVLEPGMVFMIHPNQYLPETGYLLCGEPVVLTGDGAEPLTRSYAALAELA